MRVKLTMVIEAEMEPGDATELRDELTVAAKEFVNEDPQVVKVKLKLRTMDDHGSWGDPVLAVAER